MFAVLLRVHVFFLKQNKISALCIIFLLVALVGYLDYATGFEISLSFLYIVPIALATWYVDSMAGFLVTFISVATWTISNWAAGEVYSQEVIRYWNAFTRLLIFVLILWLLQEFKRALAHERLLSQTDHLTGIANSREFYQVASVELTRTARSKIPLSVAYIDLDGFKTVNDTLGHRAGDHLLRTVAQTFQATIRKTDLAGRLGGDEFAILLPNTDQAGARYIMQRVHTAFMEQMEKLQSSVTLSAGVISFTSIPASVDEIIHEVDNLMYEVKSHGKNGITYVARD